MFSSFYTNNNQTNRSTSSNGSGSIHSSPDKFHQKNIVIQQTEKEDDSHRVKTTTTTNNNNNNSSIQKVIIPIVNDGNQSNTNHQEGGGGEEEEENIQIYQEFPLDKNNSDSKDNIYHQDDDDDDDSSSPNLFDEISISTKDSFGPTAFIEPIFDLQAATATTTATTRGASQKKIFDQDGSIHDSQCIQMYHCTNDQKELTANDQDIDIHNDYSNNNNNNSNDSNNNHDDIDCFDNNQESSTSNENKQNKRDDATKDDQNENKQEVLVLSQEEEDEDEDEVVAATTGVRVENESLISYDSFQRMVKRAFLRSKVEKKRQDLTSKMNILNSVRTDGSGTNMNATRVEIEGFVCQEEEVVVGGSPNSHDDVAGVNEDVFLGLGKLMYKEDGDNEEEEEEEEQCSEVPASVASNTYWNLISSKNAFRAIIAMSLVLNCYNYLILPSVEVEETVTSTQVKDAMNLFLIHTKLNKVHDEVKKIHLEKQQTDFLTTLKTSIIACIILAMMIANLLKYYTIQVNNRNESYDFTSPHTTNTKRKSLKRELSSLDKKNIFPSTVSTVTVQKDGTLAEVKRTMRFSPPGVKRFTSPEPQSLLTQSSLTLPSLKKASSKQRPRKQKSCGSGMKSPGLFSPRFQKMKAVKE